MSDVVWGMYIGLLVVTSNLGESPSCQLMGWLLDIFDASLQAHDEKF